MMTFIVSHFYVNTNKLQKPNSINIYFPYKKVFLKLNLITSKALAQILQPKELVAFKRTKSHKQKREFARFDLRYAMF